MSPFDLAQRYIGIEERLGEDDHPLIRWWHSLTTMGEMPDSVPWCSSFLNGICWELRLPRSKSARARSWLQVGKVASLHTAVVGWDIVILSRGANAPGPEVIEAPGHVGLFAGLGDGVVYILGANQNNAVNITPYAQDRVLGVRRVERPL